MTADQEKWNLRWLRVAREISSWSKDPSSKIGAVAVVDNRLVAHGYNGFPASIKDKEEWLNDRDIKIDMMIHAEMNLLIDAAQTSRSLKGSIVYVYGLPPCSRCVTHLWAAGVSKLVFADTKADPRWWNEFHKSIEIIKRSDNFNGTVSIYNMNEL